jgi:CBS domain-containing protein
MSLETSTSINRFIKMRQTPHMRETDFVMNAITQMMETKSGAVLVTCPHDELLGIVTERDIMTRVTAEGRDPHTTRLAEVMTTEITTITENVSLNDAIRLMSRERIRHLPVVDPDNKVLGMVTLRYLLHDRIDDLISEVQSLEAYLNDAPGG